MKYSILVISCSVLLFIVGCDLFESDSTPSQTPQEETPSSSSTPQQSRPSGTFVGTVQSIYGSLEISMTFKKDTIEYYDRINGKAILKYSISEDGSILTTTDIMGTVTSQKFKYEPEFEAVVIYSSDESHTPTTYYRK